jgi:tight adherence protein B
MNMMTLAAALLAGAAVLLIVFGLFSTRRTGVEERLERYVTPQSSKSTKATAERPGVGKMIAGSAAFAVFNRVVEKRNWSADMARELARADLTLKPSEFLAIRIGVVVAIPAIGFLLGLTILPTLANPFTIVIGAIIGFFAPRFWLGYRKGKRLKSFNGHLADTITLIANALRSGSSFLQAIELVVRETQPPISTEFGRVIREVNLGLPFEQALDNMVRRVKSEDLELMTTAISVQHTVGGNLAEILDSIAFTIRERVRIKGEIKTLTAQGRMSGYVVGFLPIGLVGILMVIAPKFMEPMLQKPPEMFGLPLGVIILGIGGVMMAVGFFLIRRIVNIEV